MALTNKQVHVELSADDTTRPAHLKVAQMTGQSILLSSVASAGSPATVAATIAPATGNAIVLDALIVGTDRIDALPLVYFGIGTEVIEMYLQGGGDLPLNFEGAVDGVAFTSLTGVQSTTHRLALIYHELDK